VVRNGHHAASTSGDWHWPCERAHSKGSSKNAPVAIPVCWVPAMACARTKTLEAALAKALLKGISSGEMGRGPSRFLSWPLMPLVISKYGLAA